MAVRLITPGIIGPLFMTFENAEAISRTYHIGEGWATQLLNVMTEITG